MENSKEKKKKSEGFFVLIQIGAKPGRAQVEILKTYLRKINTDLKNLQLKANKLQNKCFTYYRRKMYQNTTLKVLLIHSVGVLGKNLKYEDEGERLILTPLIESNQIEKARNLSKVDPTLFDGVQSYSAFITVNKTFDSNMFFWYFPAAKAATTAEETPLVIWLQGGPGGSSLFGLFSEIGPLTVVNGTVKKMPITWGDEYSLLFIDNPVGTGFSFTTKDGYSTNEDMVGSNLLNFLQQFLQVFPKLRKSPLFISGESYAGKYIPAFGHYIHNNKNDSYPINLKGLAIGDGWTDPPNLLHTAEFGLQVGLLSPEQAKLVADHETKARNFYKNGNNNQYVQEALAANEILYKFSPVYPYNYLQDPNSDGDEDIILEKFLNQRTVQNALHVGKAKYSIMASDVYEHLNQDFYRTVKPWLEELIEHYGVMCYSGQLDFIVAYALSINMYQSLKWSRAHEYLAADRVPLFDTENRNRINSFIRKGGNFWDVMVRGAGHMVPTDKPRAAKQIIDLFIKEFK